ncbi:MAG: hypothetical protein QM809_11420 [Gordonia sp. (in: high G+C Gram-positive bacteria)]|uniref:DUF7427 family protein n=1 Tax=Gordonia sp. (in: high G+C Gram-positive bacteria) TaxID=84139 RepID=UPI0039E6A71D
MDGGHAWAVLVGGVLWWERRCAVRGEPEKLLSRAMDRGREKHLVLRWVLNGVVIATALHLLRWISPRWDVYQLARWTAR